MGFGDGFRIGDVLGLQVREEDPQVGSPPVDGSFGKKFNLQMVQVVS
jgi:hypothetical protein